MIIAEKWTENDRAGREVKSWEHLLPLLPLWTREFVDLLLEGRTYAIIVYNSNLIVAYKSIFSAEAQVFGHLGE